MQLSVALSPSLLTMIFSSSAITTRLKEREEKKEGYVEKISFFSSIFYHMWTPVLQAGECAHFTVIPTSWPAGG